MILSFILLCSILSVYLWFSEKKKLQLLFRSIGLILILLIFGISGYSLQDIDYLGEDKWYNLSPYRAIILFFIMAIGMIASVLNKAISEHKKKIVQTKSAGSKYTRQIFKVDRWDVFQPFLISFLTFSGLLTQVGNQNLNLTTITLAFQTGFFWQTVLKND